MSKNAVFRVFPLHIPPKIFTVYAMVFVMLGKKFQMWEKP